MDKYLSFDASDSPPSSPSQRQPLIAHSKRHSVTKVRRRIWNRHDDLSRVTGVPTSQSVMSRTLLSNRFTRMKYMFFDDVGEDKDCAVVHRSGRNRNRCYPGLVGNLDKPVTTTHGLDKSRFSIGNDSRHGSCSSSDDEDDSFLPRHYSLPNVIQLNIQRSKEATSDVDDTTESSSESEDIDDLDRFDGAILKKTSASHSSSLTDGDVYLTDDSDSTNLNETWEDVKLDAKSTEILGTSSSRICSFKLRPHRSSLVPKRRRRKATAENELSNEIHLSRNTGIKSFDRIRKRNQSPSFDTTDTTDEDSSFASLFSSLAMEMFSTPSRSSCSLIGSSNENEKPNAIDTLSQPYNGTSASVQWSDECGLQLEVIHNLEIVQEETCRIIIVLMNAPLSPYEFLHCEFQTQPRLKIIDILKQLPTLRKQQEDDSGYLTFNEDDIQYSALCVLGKELINMLAIQDYFCIGEDDSDYTLRDGLIFLAVRSGCDSKDVITEGDKLLRNKVLRREIRKARIAGRALQSLKSTAELAAIYKQQLRAEAETRILRKQRNKSKQLGKDNIADEKGMTCNSINVPTVCHAPIPEDLDNAISICSSIDDCEFEVSHFTMVSFEKLEQLHKSTFGFENTDPIFLTSPKLFDTSERDATTDLGTGSRNQILDVITTHSIAAFHSLSISDSADMLESFVATLQSQESFDLFENSTFTNTSMNTVNKRVATIPVSGSFLEFSTLSQNLSATDQLPEQLPFPPFDEDASGSLQIHSRNDDVDKKLGKVFSKITLTTEISS